MSPDIQFADDDQAFVGSQQFQDIKNWTHEHLLTRIEELGAEFGRWSRASIQQFVELELDSFVRLQRVPINEREIQLVADALTKELAGLGPLEDLLNDPAVEDVLINGHKNVYVSRRTAAGFMAATCMATSSANFLVSSCRAASAVAASMRTSTPILPPMWT